MTFKVVIEPRALADIQQAIDYYQEQQTGLGKKFNSVLDKHISTLKKNPFFQIAYKDYRTLPVKKFPFLIFFFIDETDFTVYIISVFNTHQDTEKYPE